MNSSILNHRLTFPEHHVGRVIKKDFAERILSRKIHDRNTRVTVSRYEIRNCCLFAFWRLSIQSVQRYDSFIDDSFLRGNRSCADVLKLFTLRAILSPLRERDFIRKIYRIGMEKVFIFEEFNRSMTILNKNMDELFWIIYSKEDIICFAREYKFIIFEIIFK